MKNITIMGGTLPAISVSYGVLPDDLMKRCEAASPYPIGVHYGSDDAQVLRAAMEWLRSNFPYNDDFELYGFKYKMSIDSAGRDVYTFGATDLFFLIDALVDLYNEGNTNAGDFVSNIMTTLNVEWI